MLYIDISDDQFITNIVVDILMKYFQHAPPAEMSIMQESLSLL